MSNLTQNPAGSPRILPLEDLPKTAPKEPSDAVKEKQDSAHSEKDFVRDLDKVTRRRKPS